jgi:hypothetical protein
MRLAIVLGFLAASGLSAQDSSFADRFSFSGDMLVRGFYLARDLPLRSTSLNTTTRRREEQDLLSMRLQLDFAFRASSYVDVMYGIEVGELTFGRDNAAQAGPGSGGKGAGATNVETREAYLKVRNNPESMSLSAGILNFNTPRGLVMATSGGGLKGALDIDSIHSSIETYYIRAEDNSVIDGDSNGFSDTNFNDINLGLFTWKFSGVKGLRTELYGVYRQDDLPTSASDKYETSRVYWGGLFAQWKTGPLGLVLHGVGNWGRFWRPGSPSFNVRDKYTINAGAGQYEISWQFTDELQVALAGAGASGRLGKEPDGSLPEYRTDQFRTAGSGFQFTDIALDSSGGYTIFGGGRLTGIMAHGLQLRSTIFTLLQADVGAYVLTLYRRPVPDFNAFYKRFPAMRQSDKRFGTEYNARLGLRVLGDLKLEARFAYFDAMDGYKIVYDTSYGDDIAEVQLSVSHKF